jgi:hypothetical protein
MPKDRNDGAPAVHRPDAWIVEMHDVFDNTWIIIGRFPSREEAVAFARVEFAKRQPPPGQPDITGGPYPPGIQDRIYIIPPAGAGDSWQYVEE